MTDKIHSLAVVLGISPLIKEALISSRDEAGLILRLENKARDLAKARGHKVSPALRIGEFADRRISAPPTMPGLGPQKQRAYDVAPTLIDKSIQQQRSMPLSQQIGHKLRRGAKDFMAGKSGLGGKWKNRLALMAGLGTLGSGIKAYSDAGKAEQPPAGGKNLYRPASQAPTAPKPTAQPFTSEDLSREWSQLFPQTAGKQGNYSPTASGVPAPPTMPRVTAPGPGVASIPQIKPGEPPKIPSITKSKGLSSISPSTPKPPKMPKMAENDALPAMVAAGVGGAGGHALGEKLLAPLLKMKERGLHARIQNAQDALSALQVTQKHIPAVSAATGALLIAALTTLFLRKKKEEPVDYNKYRPYDASGGGFHPSQQQNFGSY